MQTKDLQELFRRRLDGTSRALDSVRTQVAAVAEIATVIAGRLRAGGTVYTCGNGGSAAEALHLAEELVGRYRSNRAPLAAVCLAADPTALTCIANDFGFEQVFARPCATLLDAGDTLVVLSTSGRSPNLVRALEVAREKGAVTIGLLGGDGAACFPLCDHAIIVDGPDSAPVQEGHLMIVHLICEALEG